MADRDRTADVLPLRRPTERAVPAAEPLLRELTGEVLRDARRTAGQRLVDVARRAGVSPQYLSEIERGLKDPSSEMLAAVAAALGLSLEELLGEAVRRLAPVAPAPPQRVGFAPAIGSRPLSRTIDPVCLAA